MDILTLSITLINYLGILVFAISGILAGIEKKFSLFGIFILGFVTAVGGGTLRDLLIGSAPVGWMTHEVYTCIIIFAVVLCYIWKGSVVKLKRGVFLFDTLGIGLFTVLGVQKTLAAGLSPLIAVMMGVVSAVFGGVIRDILSNQKPLLFNKEAYTLACLIGGILYIVCKLVFPEALAMVVGFSSVITIRIVAIKKHWIIRFK